MEAANHETYVSLEVAKLLIKAGFDWKQYSFYNSKGILINGTFAANWNDKIWDIDGSKISAPTLNIAQRWLREVEGIFVCVIPEIKDYHATWIFYICDAQCTLYEDDDCFLTYEEALEEGIKKTLEITLEHK